MKRFLSYLHKYQCWPTTVSKFEILAHCAFEFDTHARQAPVRVLQQRRLQCVNSRGDLDLVAIQPIIKTTLKPTFLLRWREKCFTLLLSYRRGNNYGRLTFHLLLQSEAPVDLLQLGLHGQSADVGLQVGAVHHADAEHDERDVLRLRAHQTAAAAAGELVGRVRVLLLVLEDDFAELLGGPASPFWSGE